MDTVLLDPRSTTAGRGIWFIAVTPSPLAEQAERDERGEAAHFVKSDSLQVFVLYLNNKKKD